MEFALSILLQNDIELPFRLDLPFKTEEIKKRNGRKPAVPLFYFSRYPRLVQNINQHIAHTKAVTLAFRVVVQVDQNPAAEHRSAGIRRLGITVHYLAVGRSNIQLCSIRNNLGSTAT